MLYGFGRRKWKGSGGLLLHVHKGYIYKPRFYIIFTAPLTLNKHTLNSARRQMTFFRLSQQFPLDIIPTFYYH